MRMVRLNGMKVKPPTKTALRVRAQLVRRIKAMCGGK